MHGTVLKSSRTDIRSSLLFLLDGGESISLMFVLRSYTRGERERQGGEERKGRGKRETRGEGGAEMGERKGERGNREK